VRAERPERADGQRVVAGRAAEHRGHRRAGLADPAEVVDAGEVGVEEAGQQAELAPQGVHVGGARRAEEIEAEFAAERLVPGEPWNERPCVQRATRSRAVPR
jgi:hypothetical protein